MFAMKYFLLIILSIYTTSIWMKDEKWDYLVMAVEWPPSFCYTFPKKIQCCDTSRVTGWNLHGLWPSSSKGADPLCCKNASAFDEKKLKPIMDELLKEWNPLGNCSKDFWKHEWKFHGTCASQSKLLHTELQYFNATLQMKKQLDLTNVLHQHSIKPNTDKIYQVSDFVDVIKKIYNVVPKLQCTHFKGKIYILSMEVCFDTQLKIIMCPKRHKYMDHLSRHRNKCRKPRNSTNPIHIPCTKGFLYQPFNQ